MNQLHKKGVVVIEGHVQGLTNTRALGEAGIPVFVVDTGNCVARYSKYCTKFIVCPEYNSDRFAKFLVELAKNENLKDWVLLPSNDHAVYTISKNKTFLEKYYKFTIQDLSIISRIYDKGSLLEVAQNCDVPYPKTSYIQNTNQSIDLVFPVLTKGREGLTFYKSTGKKAYLADNQQELNKQLCDISSKIELEKTFTQELIPFDGSNKTVSFTAFSINGELKTHWMGVKLREHPLQFGTATLTESIFVDDCLEYSTKLLKEIGYTGVCEVEYLRDPRDNKYKLIEINPRTWLWVGLAIKCGINYPVIVFNYLNKIDQKYPSSYESGMKWLNPYTDTIFSLLAIFKGKLSFMNYFKQLAGKRVNPLWNWSDSTPFFAYGFLLLSMVKNR